MSPVLFNLYLADLSRQLSVKCPSLQLGNTSINHLLFADDLILFGDGLSGSMNSLIKVTSDYCATWKLRIAPGKTKIIKYGGGPGVWRLPRSPQQGCDIIKEFPFAKYLGIELEPRSFKYCKRRVTKVLSIAREYAAALRHLRTDSLDRVDTALALWKSCAISSILYASEVIHLTATDLKALDKIQDGVARQICQVDNSTAGVSSLIETGLIPISILVKVRKLKFYLGLRALGDERLVKQALVENSGSNWSSPFMKEIREVLEDCDENEVDPDTILIDMTTDFYLSELERCKKSLCIFPRNYDIGNKSAFLNDSWQCGVLCSFRAGNAQLGNRSPAPLGVQVKLCPLCDELGKQELVNECHVICSCPFLEATRRAIGLTKILETMSKVYKTTNKVTLTRIFLGEDLASPPELRSRAIMLERLRTKWYNLVK